MSTLVDRPPFRAMAGWLLGLGWLAGLAAAASGLLAEEAVEEMGVPEAAIERHETLALATLAVFAAVLLVRWAVRGRWTTYRRTWYLALAVTGAVGVGLTGYAGGELVYRYGAAVERRDPPATGHTERATPPPLVPNSTGDNPQPDPP